VEEVKRFFRQDGLVEKVEMKTPFIKISVLENGKRGRPAPKKRPGIGAEIIFLTPEEWEQLRQTEPHEHT